MKKEYTDENLEKMRKVSLVLYGFSFVLAVILLMLSIMQKFNNMLFLITFTVIVISFVIATDLKLRVQPLLSKVLMRKVYSEGLSLKYLQEAGIPEKYFKDANFIKQYIAYQSFDFILGKLQDKDFIISGLVVKDLKKTTTNNETYTMYKGLFGITDFKNEDNIEMIIAPDINNKFLNSIFEDMKKTLGTNKKVIRLENPEFERFFEVYCNEQVHARKILTLVLMEKLVEFRKLINTDITIIYKNKKIYFFIADRFIINTTKLYFKGVNQETIDETKEFIKLLSEIVTNVATSPKDM